MLCIIEANIVINLDLVWLADYVGYTYNMRQLLIGLISNWSPVLVVINLDPSHFYCLNFIYQLIRIKQKSYANISKTH